MKKVVHPLIVGNWKMNPQSVTMASRLATDIKKGLARLRGAEVVIAPPFVYLDAVRRVHDGGKSFTVGAQNVHEENAGPHTGGISISMIKSFEVSHVIVGHSERRARGEKNTDINKKIHAVIKAGMTAIVCVGEGSRDPEGHYLGFIETQVREACAGIPKSKLTHLVIAYEPLWAIGTGKNATPENVHEVKLFIQKLLTDMYGRTAGTQVRVLYGGSVNQKNALELLEEGQVDGFLVGGSSLSASEFVGIVKAAQ